MEDSKNTLADLLRNLEVDADIECTSILGQDPILRTPFLIGNATAVSIAATGIMANKLWRLGGGSAQKIEVDMRGVRFALRGEHHYTRDGLRAPNVWHEVSGFFKTADERWVQLHCNMPHLRSGILRLLNAEEDYDSVSKAVRRWTAFDLEKAAVMRNLCVAAVRSDEEWRTHPHAKAINALPLLEVTKIGDSDPEQLAGTNRPLSGARVLDLTHVIAGPVCGRTLAEHGADVMRISAPGLYNHEPFVIDTGHGKLSAFLNLKTHTDRQQFVSLVKDSYIVVQGFRPGAMESLDLGSNTLSETRPGLIYVTLSAFGHTGPWRNRRGFDSLLQSTTGIVHESQQQGVPEHLPAQALDYVSGYLAAFGTMVALERRIRTGGSYLVRVSLAQTGNWIQSLGRSNKTTPAMESQAARDLNQWMVTTPTDFGLIKHIRPVLRMSETLPHWDRPTCPYGTHTPQWPG